MNLQDLIDGMGAREQRARGQTQLTLGALIDILSAMDSDKAVEAIGSAHSYRGYYCDLAFERLGGTTRAAEVLAVAKACMGEVFEGYKGGEFQMGRNTPIWVAHYGSGGDAIIGIDEDGKLKVRSDD